ncbi:APC family permease [Desulfitibacter alkalitolerans]|uniref:APC family permease n=1 Tax=Desulfitibacter alkalitolerans TaxID=264641 RepID=UPI000484D36E|nr:amino acid permease [Desulfitibacter alkalitolerans]
MNQLRKNLGLFDSVALAIGSIIGSGLLLLPGLVYSISGADSIIAWILMGLFTIPFILIFADLTVKFPAADGVAGFVNNAFGKTLAQGATYLVIGSVPVGIPTLALIGANYLAYSFSLSYTTTLLAGFFIVLFTVGLNWNGSRFSSSVQNLSVVSLVILLFAVVVIGLPKAAANPGAYEFQFGIFGIWEAMALIFWAFLGWENMSFIAEEFKNPARDFPKSMFISFVIIMILYLGISVNAVGLLNQSAPETVQAPIAEMFRVSVGSGLEVWIGLVSFLIIIINGNAWVWGTSRLIFAGGRSGSLPVFFGKINNSRGVPRYSLAFILAAGGITILLIGVMNIPLAFFVKIVSQNFLMLYLLSILAYIKINTSVNKRIIGVFSLILCSFFLLIFGWGLIYSFVLLAVPYIRSVISKGLGSA